MKEITKRLLSLIMALALVITALPMDAFAAEPESHEGHDHAEEVVLTSEEEETKADAAPAVEEAEEEVEEEEPAKEESEEEPKEEETAKEETTTEESLFDQVNAEIDRILNEYLGKTDATEEEIQKVVDEMDGNTWDEAYFAMLDVEEMAEGLTEDEFNKLENTETIVEFRAVMEAGVNVSYLADKTNTVLDGQVSITDSVGTGSVSDGTVKITAKGGTLSRTTNNVTICNKSDKTATLKFNFALTGNYNSFTFPGTSATSGEYSGVLKSGESVKFVFESQALSRTATLTLSDFSLIAVAEKSNVTIKYDSALGSVTAAGATVSSESSIEVSATAGSELVATANSGVTFLGWINDDTGEIVSESASFTYNPAADISLRAVFVKDTSSAHFMVGNNHLFDSLDKAVEFAVASGVSADKKIVLMNSGVLPKGDYSIPSGITLLIPFDDANTLYTTSPKGEHDVDPNNTNIVIYKTPTCYRKMTMAEGAKITIDGVVSLSAKHNAANGGSRSSGSPKGPCSFVEMNSGSNIIVNDGGVLYVYGYITGSGSITANSGAKVYENFQVEDFRGGSQTTDMENAVFPLSQYYVQNIEVPLTLYAGATEYSYTSFHMSNMVLGSSVAFISNKNAMFNLTSGYVKKYYDGSKDRMIIEADGNMSIDPITMKIGSGLLSKSIDSKNYVLPITNNFTVSVNSGSIVLNQMMALLPGAEIKIGENATCSLGNGVKVYVYDADEWGNFCGSVNRTYLPVQYAPGRKYNRTEADLKDATVQIEGMMDVSAGYMYTTAGGANIISDGKGTVKTKVGTDTITYQLVQGVGYTEIPITPVRLKNVSDVEPEYISSIDSTSQIFNNVDGVWHSWKTEYTVDKAPTCTEVGSKSKHCEIIGCTATTENEPMVALGHNEVVVPSKEPTCTEPGLEEGAKCSVCGDIITAQTEIPALGHTEEVVEGDATCTTAGKTDGKYCAVCDTWTVPQEEKSNGLGHLFTSYVPDGNATCTEDGTKTATCDRDGCNATDTVTDEGSASHIWSYEKKIVKEPTCIEKGIKAFVCTRNNCDATNKPEDIEMVAHAYDNYTYNNDATCAADGTETGKCTTDGCDAKDTRTAEGTQLEHLWTAEEVEIKAPTCTVDGVKAYRCTREGCGVVKDNSEEPIDALDHDWSEWTVTTNVTCTTNGEQEATCKRSGCGEKKTETITAKGHTTVVSKEGYEATCTVDGLTDEEKCSVCREVLKEQVVITAPGHQAELREGYEATCTTPGKTDGEYCNVCKTWPVPQEVLPAGHVYDLTKYTVDTYPTCTTPGQESVHCTREECKQIHPNPAYTKELVALGHEYKEEDYFVEVEPTCTENGSKIAECSRDTCNVQNIKTIDTLGHDLPEEWTVVDEATCKSKGYNVKECSRCDYFEEQYIDTLPHEWKTSYTTDREAFCHTPGEKSIHCKNCTARTAVTEVTVPHSFTNYVPDGNIICTEGGTQTAKCDNCEEISTIEIEITEHVFGGWTVEKEPTCTEDGNWIRECENCTATEIKPYEALGHTAGEYKTVNEPTCKAEGSKIQYCSVCDEPIEGTEKPLDPLQHEFKNYVSNEDATCTKDGTMTAECEHGCGEKSTIPDENNKAGHKWNLVKTEDETCTADGKEFYECENCDETKTEVLPALGHDWINDAKVEPTCTTPGEAAGKHCSRCDAEEGEGEIPALGHDWDDGTVLEEAECEVAGSMKHECRRCDATKTEVIPAKEHLNDITLEAVESTCTSTGLTAGVRCSACGEDTTPQTKVDKKEHSFTNYVYDGNATCTEKGTQTAKCDNCDETNTIDHDKLGHRYYDWEVVTEPTCENDGLKHKDCIAGDDVIEEVIPALTHDPSDWLVVEQVTCTKDGKEHIVCKRENCKKELDIRTVDALQHDFQNYTVLEAATCTKDEVQFAGCSRCDAIDTKTIEGTKTGHTYPDDWTVVKAATCTEDGSKQKTCTVTTCKNVVTEVIESEGHIYKESEIDRAPTCTEPGEKSRHCENCTDRVDIETITKLGHDFKNYVSNEDANCTTDGTKTAKCERCPEVNTIDDVNSKLGHDWSEWSVVKAAACGVQGTDTRSCGRCTGVETRVVDALKHLWAEEFTEDIAPTCTEAGSKSYHCERDNCTAKNEITPIEKLNHSFTNYVSNDDAKCEVDGTKIAKCDRCDETDTVTDKGSALKHVEEVVEGKAATCTEAGLTEGKICTVCKKELLAQTVIEALDHSFTKYESNNDAACEVDGTKTAKCDRCDETDTVTDEGSALAHEEKVVEGKAATCTEAGLTEGKICTVCEKELLPQEVIEALDHSFTKYESNNDAACEVDGTKTAKCDRCEAIDTVTDEGSALEHKVVVDEAVEATCTVGGLTEGSHCEVCEAPIVAQEAIDPLGHDWDEGVIQAEPTYEKDGLKVYTCSRCEEMELEVLPMRGQKEINDYDSFVTSLAILEEAAYAYSVENPGNDPLGLVIKYIRTGVDRYNSGSWGIMAGYENKDFANFVVQMEDMLNEEAEDESQMLNITGLKNINNFTLPNGDKVDFGHMFGMMDIAYTNLGSENHEDVGGWAGDLVDLLSLTDRHYVTAATFEELVADINANYLGQSFDESDTFGLADIYGDLDGYYLMEELDDMEYEYGDLATLISERFTKDLTDVDRAEYFLENRIGGSTTRSAVRDSVYEEYLTNNVVGTLEATREFVSEDITELRRACCYAFADYICKLAGDYVDKLDNEYFEVFQTESSTLAPGVTQVIKKAMSADNKQMVYYLATADITRSDVHIYANYKDNDPTLGWGMARVLDQAQAAQDKYGDPESEHYIENYNVIASVNADGYNMQTGEPGGMLVMNGVHHKPADGDGFFAILKDGTPMIGTKADYDRMKDQIQEGVGAFGATLVKDGKIAVNRTENYFTSRASRTAVGITKTGKVVFMVLDGRQEPISCGGSMEEIAQIMLEAGCVHAVNLDGGGSTTYVARQEGEEELSVVSKPSDGVQRSVSTTMMIVSTAPSSKTFDHAVIEADTNLMTVGAKLQLEASGVSATGNKTDLPEGTTWAVSNEEDATISEDGVLTALSNGDVIVYLMSGDKVVGEKTIKVVVPDKLRFAKPNINAVYGQKIDLPIEAYYEGKRVTIKEDDVKFTTNKENAGTFEGWTFTGDEASGVKQVTVTASLTMNEEVTASTIIAVYKQGELSFDFDRATGGTRMFAWDRQVSNSTTEDNISYRVKDTEEDMVTSYTFAIDMTQIPIPEVLSSLTSMLPGADMENASAWNFLLQLAERVSVLTTVTPVIDFDDNVEVDYSNMKIVNDYFILEKTDFDEETNKMTLTLRWKDQTAAIDPAMANPLCLVNGIKLTPKDDANWDKNSALNIVNTGNIGYRIYLRANALYSFANDPKNQEAFKLTPFVNPDLPSETGAYFEDTYTEFEDNYKLINAVKDGWIYETDGYAYYLDGERLTGIHKIEGYYYKFDDNGICKGKEKYTGFVEEDGELYYSGGGELKTGWMFVEDNYYYFDPEKGGAAIKEGKHKIHHLRDIYYEYEFQDYKLYNGVWIKYPQGLKLMWAGSYRWNEWFTLRGETYHFDKFEYAATGLAVIDESSGGDTYAYRFSDKGVLIERVYGDGLLQEGNVTIMLKDSICQYAGVVQDEEGNYYYINSEKKAVTDRMDDPYVITKTNGLIPPGPYQIDKTGKIQIHLEHKYGDWIVDKDATCTVDGERHKECTGCDEEITEVIPATGHEFDEEWIVEKEPTCTTKGVVIKKCHNCDKKETAVVKARGHKYSTKWTIDKKATTSKDGSKSKHCTVCDAKTSVTKIKKASNIKLSTTSYTYNGKAKNPKLTIKDSSGKTISSSNYTVKKPSGRKKVGKYTYKITFKNEYSGTKSISITIKPAKTSISKLTKAKKAFTVKWKKKSTQVTGYQIQYSTSKTFKDKYTKKKTVSSYKTTSKKITGLKAKKTYYVRVRTYKTVSGKKYYSSWSTVKKVKTK